MKTHPKILSFKFQYQREREKRESEVREKQEKNKNKEKARKIGKVVLRLVRKVKMYWYIYYRVEEMRKR
jgi:hypothetical protein